MQVRLQYQRHFYKFSKCFRIGQPIRKPGSLWKPPYLSSRKVHICNNCQLNPRRVQRRHIRWMGQSIDRFERYLNLRWLLRLQAYLVFKLCVLQCHLFQNYNFNLRTLIGMNLIPFLGGWTSSTRTSDNIGSKTRSSTTWCRHRCHCIDTPDESIWKINTSKSSGTTSLKNQSLLRRIRMADVLAVQIYETYLIDFDFESIFIAWCLENCFASNRTGNIGLWKEILLFSKLVR